MLKHITNFFHALTFFLSVWATKLKGNWMQGFLMRQKLNAREKFEKQWRARYLAQAQLKKGDTYRLGAATVTLATFGRKGKQEVKKKIKLAEQLQKEKWKKLRARGIEIMMMNPEELLQFRISEWLEKHKKEMEKINQIMSAPETPPPTDSTHL